MDKVDYSKLEDDIFVFLNNYSNGNFGFYFTPKYIYVYQGEKNVLIDMSQNYKDIAIYNIYKGNNDIYDGTYEGKKDLFVFMPYYGFDSYYEIFKQEGDNLFLDIRVEISEEQLSKGKIKEIVDNKINSIKDKIDNLKEELKTNKNKAIVYETYVSFYTNEFDGKNKLTLSEMSSEYRMSKDYYNSTFYKHIAKSNTRDFEGGVNYGNKYFFYSYDLEEKDIIEQEETHENRFILLY